MIFPSKPGLTVIQRKPTPPKSADTVLLWSPIPLAYKNYRPISDTLILRKVGKTTIKAEAVTCTAILANFQCEGNKFYYEVQNLFSLQHSWYLKKIIGDSAILSHEQLHFDITELYARKIRKLLAEYPNPSGKEKEIRALVNSLKKAERKENDLYDVESLHHLNKEMQKKWNERIKKELLEYAAYAGTRGIRTLL
jgi:hypothetical protein